MISVKELSTSRRKDDFYKSLNLSVTTTNNYRSALQSSFLTGVLKEEFNTLDLFEIVDLEELWELYSKINLHPKNIKNLRCSFSPVCGGGFSIVLLFCSTFTFSDVSSGTRP